MNNRDVTYVSTTEIIPETDWLTMLCEAIYISAHATEDESVEIAVA